ncbi:MAG TPA: glycosyltransferase [Terriglobales bacterium]|nr:glycosyltransferase [Terriglobales bacterium]
MPKLQPQTSSPPRVVHMTSAHEWWDGRIFQKECRSLANAGYEVIELTNEETDTHQDGVRIRGLGACRSRLHRVTSKMIVMACQGFRSRADVYHFHDPDLLPVGLLLRAFNKCVIYDIHEDVPRTVLHKHYVPARLRVPLMWLTELVENSAARAMSGLVAATPAIAHRFCRINSNTVVVNNFPILSELALTNRKAWSARSMSVAYIGGIAEGRGIREVLSAISQVPETGAKLELAGWYSNPALETELIHSSAWRYVEWHGLLCRAGIAELLGSVRAGLVPFHPEPNCVTALPTKLFEYMSAGIPVIASDFPLWRSIVEGAGCGLLVDPCEPASIAKAISYLLTHDTEAEAMGKRGRAAVERQYNWGAEERSLLNFYSALTHSKCDKARLSNQYIDSESDV